MNEASCAPEIEFIINQVGNPKSRKKVKDLGVETTNEVRRRIEATLPGSSQQGISVSTTADMVNQLWPVMKTVGPIEIRGHAGNIRIFDTQRKTMTGSPVSQVLKVAQNRAGRTCVLVYGDVLGNKGDDMYAWISTTTGSRMHVGKIGGKVDDQPIRHLPDGFVELAA